MDRIAVAGDRGKADHVGGIDGLLKHLGHADREVLKIKHLQRQHFTALRVIGPAVGLGQRPAVFAPRTSPCSMALGFLQSFFRMQYLTCCAFALPSVSLLSCSSASPCR